MRIGHLGFGVCHLGFASCAFAWLPQLPQIPLFLLPSALKKIFQVEMGCGSD